MHKGNALILALVTLVGFPAIGFTIHYFTQTTPFTDLFISHTNIWRELGMGCVYGTVTGLTGLFIIDRPFMAKIRARYTGLIRSLQLSTWQVLFISICAGVGEEILFRGALQPHMGVWLTAVVFVAIHGYLNPWNWRISVYGAFMTLAIAGIGFMAKQEGLTAAMTAHTFIDIVLLYHLSGNRVR